LGYFVSKSLQNTYQPKQSGEGCGYIFYSLFYVMSCFLKVVTLHFLGFPVSFVLNQQDYLRIHGAWSFEQGSQFLSDCSKNVQSFTKNLL